MDEWAKLITAFAALLASVAWPVILLVAILGFRKEIRLLLEKFPSVIDRMKALKLGAIETELERVADQSTAQPNSGEVTFAEVEAAVRIKSEAQVLGEKTLAAQLDKLCIEYDTVRRVMRPSDRRTSAMTRILVQMRSLGPTVANFIGAYKSSRSSGGRLAAVAIMQMRPDKADLDWLLQRFREDHPFILGTIYLTSQ